MGSFLKSNKGFSRFLFLSLHFLRFSVENCLFHNFIFHQFTFKMNDAGFLGRSTSSCPLISLKINIGIDQKSLHMILRQNLGRHAPTIPRPLPPRQIWPLECKKGSLNIAKGASNEITTLTSFLLLRYICFSRTGTNGPIISKQRSQACSGKNTTTIRREIKGECTIFYNCFNIVAAYGLMRAFWRTAHEGNVRSNCLALLSDIFSKSICVDFDRYR